MEPFSLSRRGRLEKTLGRSPGLGFPTRRAFPSLDFARDSGLCLRLSSPLQWRDRAGFAPDFPGA